MEELLRMLSSVGMPVDEVIRIRDYYKGDEPGLQHYVTYIVAMFDDRHEYI